MKGKSSHEQNAGLVLIDKSKHLTGLLAACKLLDPSDNIRSSVLEHVDRNDVYWIGLSIIGKQFTFADSYKAGAIGLVSLNQDNASRVCSANAIHVDDNNLPAWITAPNLDESIEGYMLEPGDWMAISETGWCLAGGEFIQFDEDTMYLFTQIRRIYQQSIKEVKTGKRRKRKRKERKIY
jgi:hypothetical protein